MHARDRAFVARYLQPHVPSFHERLEVAEEGGVLFGGVGLSRLGCLLGEVVGFGCQAEVARDEAPA